MDEETAIAALGALDLFADFSTEHLRLLAFVCQEDTLAPGEILSEAGSAPGGAHVLVTGALEARHPEGGSPFRITPPALIGEIGLMLDKPRTTTIAAARSSSTLFVPRQSFMKLLRSHPELADGVAQSIRGELTRYLEQISGLGPKFA